MTDSAEALARELADLKRRIAAMERKSQVVNSTLTDANGNPLSIRDGILSGVAAGAAAAEAVDRAASAEAKADGAVVTYFGSVEPGPGAKFGDLWRDVDGTVRQFDGEEWVDLTDPTLAAGLEEALDRITNTEEAIDGKVQTFFVSSHNPPPTDSLGVGDLWIVTDGGNLIRRWNGNDWDDAPAGAAALADHAVTSTKLETDLVLSTRIIAGPQNGTHAEMKTDGFHVYAAQPSGTPSEAIRLGVDSADDYFSVTKSDGSFSAGISQGGKISAHTLDASTMYYKGRDLEARFADAPKGIIALGNRQSHATWITPGTVRPYLRVDATLEPGRQYAIWTSPLVVVNSNNLGTAAVYLGYTVGQEATTSNYTTIQAVRAPGDWTQVQFREPFQLPAQYTSPQTVSFLLAHEAGTRDGGLYCEAGRPGHLVVEDIGRAAPSVGTELNASTDRSPIKTGESIIVACTSVQNYRNTTGNWWGDAPSYSPVLAPKANDLPAGRAYTGRDPNGSGDYACIAMFPDVTTRLSGKNVAAVELVTFFPYWYHNSGGIANVYTHSYTATPNTYNASQTRLVGTASIPRPGWGWIELDSSVGNQFKTGAARGISLRSDLTIDNYGYATADPDESDPLATAPFALIFYCR